MVAHNASFDQGFLNAACARAGIKRNPFHPFSTFDTVSLAALAYGQTVLARAVKAAGFEIIETGLYPVSSKSRFVVARKPN